MWYEGNVKVRQCNLSPQHALWVRRRLSSTFSPALVKVHPGLVIVVHTMGFPGWSAMKIPARFAKVTQPGYIVRATSWAGLVCIAGSLRFCWSCKAWRQFGKWCESLQHLPKAACPCRFGMCYEGCTLDSSDLSSCFTLKHFVNCCRIKIFSNFLL